MRELCALLERFWIVKQQDKELYFQVKRALPQHRKFINELLGWNLIVNEKVIKLEKTPAYSAPSMGIVEFDEILDYCMLCALLIFLEDMDDGRQFLLSEMVVALSAFLGETAPVDWTQFQHRKSLVRVLRYVERIGILQVYEGESAYFANSTNHEVLYENTGLSRFFSVYFSRGIADFKSVTDFEQNAFPQEESDRGRLRINRVYRQLTTAPAYYWFEYGDSGYEYIKNQRQWIAQNLDKAMGGELHIHKNGAFFVLDENNVFGLRHPRDTTLSDAVLILCKLLRDDICSGVLERGKDDIVHMTWQTFFDKVTNCKEVYGAGWSKTLREKSMEELSEMMASYMEDWMLLFRQGDRVFLYPGVGKWTGYYPKDYQTGDEADEQMDDA